MMKNYILCGKIIHMSSQKYNIYEQNIQKAVYTTIDKEDKICQNV